MMEKINKNTTLYVEIHSAGTGRPWNKLLPGDIVVHLNPSNYPHRSIIGKKSTFRKGGHHQLNGADPFSTNQLICACVQPHGIQRKAITL